MKEVRVLGVYEAELLQLLRHVTLLEQDDEHALFVQTRARQALQHVLEVGPRVLEVAPRQHEHHALAEHDRAQQVLDDAESPVELLAQVVALVGVGRGLQPPHRLLDPVDVRGAVREEHVVSVEVLERRGLVQLVVVVVDAAVGERLLVVELVERVVAVAHVGTLRQEDRTSRRPIALDQRIVV